MGMLTGIKKCCNKECGGYSNVLNKCTWYSFSEKCEDELSARDLVDAGYIADIEIETIKYDYEENKKEDLKMIKLVDCVNTNCEYQKHGKCKNYLVYRHKRYSDLGCIIKPKETKLKVTKDELKKLENMRIDEIKQSVPMYERRTYFWRIGKLLGKDENTTTEDLSIGELKYMIEYWTKVLELNDEVKGFEVFTEQQRDEIPFIDFVDGWYIKEDGVSLIKKAITECEYLIKEKSLVDVPENLKHLVPKLEESKAKEKSNIEEAKKFMEAKKDDVGEFSPDRKGVKFKIFESPVAKILKDITIENSKKPEKVSDKPEVDGFVVSFEITEDDSPNIVDLTGVDPKLLKIFNLH